MLKKLTHICYRFKNEVSKNQKYGVTYSIFGNVVYAVMMSFMLNNSRQVCGKQIWQHCLKYSLETWKYAVQNCLINLLKHDLLYC